MTVTMRATAEVKPMTNTRRQANLGRSVSRGAQTMLSALTGVAADVGIVDYGLGSANAVGVVMRVRMTATTA